MRRCGPGAGPGAPPGAVPGPLGGFGARPAFSCPSSLSTSPRVLSKTCHPQTHKRRVCHLDLPSKDVVVLCPCGLLGGHQHIDASSLSCSSGPPAGLFFQALLGADQEVGRPPRWSSDPSKTGEMWARRGSGGPRRLKVG